MKVGFTGTRQRITPEQFATLNAFISTYLPITEFHHGDCIGADAEAHSMACRTGAKIVVHPPTDDRYRAHMGFKVATSWELLEPKPYLERNDDIVAAVDVLLACPFDSEEQERGGTWYTVRRARAAMKPIGIIWPDGTFTDEREFDRVTERIVNDERIEGP